MPTPPTDRIADPPTSIGTGPTPPLALDVRLTEPIADGMTGVAESPDALSSADQTYLRPILLDRVATRPRVPLVCAFFACMLLYFNYLPLWHTDIWGFVHYGKWILEHGRLPVYDPFMPLAEGVRVIDSSWLAQVVFAQIERLGGAEWLSNIYALTQVALFAVLARTFYLQTSSVPLSLTATSFLFFTALSRLLVIRPEMFGALCGAILFCWMAYEERSRLREATGQGGGKMDAWPWRQLDKDAVLRWAGVPALFILWANLHGSFIVGLAILGCRTIACAVEAVGQERHVRALWRDRRWRQSLLLTELAIAGSLVNPYGLDLLLFSARFSSHPNLRAVLEWKPFVLPGAGGIHFAISLVVLLGAVRWSRRPFRPLEVLLVALFAWATLTSIRMISWYAFALGYALAPHLKNIAERCYSAPALRNGSFSSILTRLLMTRSWKYSFVAVWIGWVTFALSGLSRPVLGGNPRTPEQIYHSLTPRGVSEYLRAYPPQGQVWNPQVIGDWLAWDGPPGLQLFTSTNIHLIPHQVWRDYLHIFDALPGWERTLDKYNVNTVIVDKVLQKTLPRLLRRSSAWSVAYDDDQGTVFVRSRRTTSDIRSPTDSAPDSITSNEAAAP